MKNIVGLKRLKVGEWLAAASHDTDSFRRQESGGLPPGFDVAVRGDDDRFKVGGIT